MEICRWDGSFSPVSSNLVIVVPIGGVKAVGTYKLKTKGRGNRPYKILVTYILSDYWTGILPTGTLPWGIVERPERCFICHRDSIPMRKNR